MRLPLDNMAIFESNERKASQADVNIGDGLALPHSLKSTKWGSAPHYSSYQDVERFFDSWADGPDFAVRGSINYDTDVAQYYMALKTLCDKLLPRVAPGSEILDIGCGTGLAGKPFIEQGMSLTGIDLSAKMLSSALARGYKSVHQIDITSEKPPFSSVFDCLLSVGVFGEWVSAEAVLPNLISMLKPVSIIGLTSEVEHTDISSIERILAENNFDVTSKERAPGWYDPQYPPEDYFYLIAQRSR